MGGEVDMTLVRRRKLQTVREKTNLSHHILLSVLVWVKLAGGCVAHAQKVQNNLGRETSRLHPPRDTDRLNSQC